MHNNIYYVKLLSNVNTITKRRLFENFHYLSCIQLWLTKYFCEKGIQIGRREQIKRSNRGEMRVHEYNIVQCCERTLSWKRNSDLSVCQEDPVYSSGHVPWRVSYLYVRVCECVVCIRTYPQMKLHWGFFFLRCGCKSSTIAAMLSMRLASLLV